MKTLSKLIVPSLLILAACAEGGEGRSIDEVPANTPPTLSGPAAVSIEENTRIVASYTAADAEGNPITFSLAGDDAASFSLSGAGELSFAVPADFEAPEDVDGDNVYNVTVLADDTFTVPAMFDVVVTVTDVEGDAIPQNSQNVTTDDTTFIQENIISSFEFPTLILNDTDNFTVTGIFDDPAAAQVGWNNFESNADAARIGDASVSTCEFNNNAQGCDAPQGSILIRNVEVTKGSITFLMSGGAGNNNVGVEIINPADDSVLGRYTPNSCGDPYLRGDQHYVHFETSGLIGATVNLRIFDEESGGCGFVAFDHFYQTDTPRGPQAASVSIPLTGTNVSIEDAANTGLITGASFEAPVDMVTNRGWEATGAFADPTQTSWQGTTRFDEAAHVGDWAVSTCEMNDNAAGCDAPVGSLISPPFRVTSNFLNFLMGGGNGSVPVGINILDGAGNTIHTYSPNSCGPAFIDGNNDWTSIDMTAIAGASVQFELFDNEPGGCGFLSFDHFYLADAAYNPTGDGQDGGAVVLTPAAEANLGFNVTLNPDSFAQVIGTFDDATTNDWTPTGAFMMPANADAWSNIDNPARVGARGVNTCEINMNSMGCDAPTGSLTSPAFMVSADRPVLNFLMAGGNGAAPVGLRVLAADDSVIASHTPNACDAFGLNGDDDWVSIDLAAQAGNMVRVEVFDEEAGGCGFVAFDHVHMSATARQ